MSKNNCKYMLLMLISCVMISCGSRHINVYGENHSNNLFITITENHVSFASIDRIEINLEGDGPVYQKNAISITRNNKKVSIAGGTIQFNDNNVIIKLIWMPEQEIPLNGKYRLKDRGELIK